jgi:chemotaxis response regulator CheB
MDRTLNVRKGAFQWLSDCTNKDGEFNGNAKSGQTSSNTSGMASSRPHLARSRDLSNFERCTLADFAQMNHNRKVQTDGIKIHPHSPAIDTDFPVVCIGLSAGGIDPLQTIFRGINPRTGMAFV